MDSPSSDDTAFVKVTFSPDPGFKLAFDGMSGTEELGRPFTYYLQMTSGTLKANVGALLGSTAVISLTTSETTTADADTRHINAIVARVVSRGLSGGSYRYDIELKPWIWLLSHITDSRIFQSKSAFTIVTDLFREAGFSDFEDSRQAMAGDLSLVYCVQYRETTLDFVTRLMEEFGFYYYFKHSEESHTLVFADDPNAHTELSDAIPFQFDQTEYRAVMDHVWEWAGDWNLNSGKFTLKDYNFGMPSLDLTKKAVSDPDHQYGSFEIYEYPGYYINTTQGEKLVDVRMQAVAAERAVFHGASNSRKLHAGWKFTLSNFPDTDANMSYLIVRSEITTSIAEGLSSQNSDGGGKSIDTYRVVLHAIPGTVSFRLPRKTPRPMIRGPQTAKVVGVDGDEITTDKFGRIKVKFHWDRSDKQDETCTCWIRVAQGWSGTSWGSIFIPRIGMEVIVEFLEGNPDRPIVTGCVYNATTTVPYTLPDEKTKSTVKTNSSLGGDGYNEFRFEDKKGSEEIYFQAEKDFNKLVKNDETINVNHDRTHTVKNNDTLTVSEGNRSITVSKGDDSHTVSTGKYTQTVQANHSTTVNQGDLSLTVTAGKLTETVQQNYSTTVNEGDLSLTVTAGKLTETVQQNYSTTVNSGNYALTVTAGSHSVEVPANSSSLNASTGITLQCGSSVISMGPEAITISSPSITILGDESIAVTTASLAIT